MKLENRHIQYLIFGVAVALYLNTIGHGFVLDDKIVITHNQFTKKGLNGLGDSFFSDSMTGFFGEDKKLVAGGRYRPLTMALHAVEYEFFGKNPMPYHLINILLYAFLVLLIYRILLRLYPPKEERHWFSLAFMVALIYAAHPLHTEVVANVKSQDELLSAVFAFLAWDYWLRTASTNEWRSYLFPGLFMFLSLMAKESSIAFVVLIPLSGLLLQNSNRSQSLRTAAPLVVAAVTYIALRISVLGSAKLEVATELMNNPFVNAGSSEKFATIFLTYYEYFRLLVFPFPLTHDYYPKHIPIVGWSEWKVILSVLAHLAILAVVWVKRKNRSLLFWVLFYFGNFFLYSNIVFNIGTFMNERFLFLSSLSFAVFIGLLIRHFMSGTKTLIPIFGIAALWSVISFNRNLDWESDRSLALADVEVSSNSAKAQMAAGSAYLDWANETSNETEKQQLLNKSIVHLRKSLEIYPRYFPPMILMGNALAAGERFKESLQLYQNCFKLNPGHQDAMNNTLYVAQQSRLKKDFETSIKAYEILLSQKQELTYYAAIGEIYGKELGNLDRSFDFITEGLKRFPDNSELNQKAGVVMAMKGRPEEALSYFLKALESSPDNGHLYLNIGITYRSLGQLEKAEEFIGKALELEPSLRKG